MTPVAGKGGSYPGRCEGDDDYRHKRDHDVAPFESNGIRSRFKGVAIDLYKSGMLLKQYESGAKHNSGETSYEGHVYALPPEDGSCL